MTAVESVPVAEGDVLGPLVRVIEEAADEDVWALVGAAALRLQGVPASSPNLEFVTTEGAALALAEMLDVPSGWQRGEHLEARRLHFMRGRVPVFVHASPTFHGAYDALRPIEIPALWDARASIDVPGIDGRSTPVAVTPLEWELLLAVVLGVHRRVEDLSARLRERGSDGRLLTRLMREGRVQTATEEAVWAHLEAA